MHPIIVFIYCSSEKSTVESPGLGRSHHVGALQDKVQRRLIELRHRRHGSAYPRPSVTAQTPHGATAFFEDTHPGGAKTTQKSIADSEF
jgi:hypothetical protein